MLYSRGNHAGVGDVEPVTMACARYVCRRPDFDAPLEDFKEVME